MGRTGLIPATFADQGIKFRIPYSMPGELLVQANQSGVFFPEAVFLHNVDKPFEVWRMMARLTAVDEEGGIIFPQPSSNDLEKLVRLTVRDTSKNEQLTKAPNLVDTLIGSEQGSNGSWEWEVPYTMVRSEGFMVGVDTLAFPTIVIPDPIAPGEFIAVAMDRVRVEISFQGYLDVIQPASDSR